VEFWFKTGDEMYLGVKLIDLAEGDNAKLVTKFVLNNRALVLGTTRR
jgi:hypothetical protein